MRKTSNPKKYLAVLILFAVGLWACQPAYSQPWDGSGVEGDPYQIWTAEDMQAIGADANYWDAHFKLMADIDLRGYTGNSFNQIGVYYHDESLGQEVREPFTGVFDGNGHTISNFNYTSVDVNGIGLFGLVGPLYGESEWYSGEIKNLILEDPNIDAGTGQEVGALAGRLHYAQINNCYIEGGNIRGYSDYMGGLVGVIDDGKMTQCSTSGTIYGRSYAGGLVSVSNLRAQIEYCSSKCNVTGNDSIGGLIGLHSGSISDCYALGNVSSEGVNPHGRVGGLVGYNKGIFHGEGFEGAYVDRCYSTGEVTSLQNTSGGLIGVNEGYVSNCFWDIESSGKTSSDGGTGKTTEEMNVVNTFTSAGWDFTSPVWEMCIEPSYPIFWWQECLVPDSVVELEIIGPNEVAENFQAQYIVNAHYETGNIKDVTFSAAFTVEPNTVAVIDESGKLKTEIINTSQDITIFAQYSEGGVSLDKAKTVRISPYGPDPLVVPDEYATIQAAIDAANNDDTILILQGVYTGGGNRDIDFKGKSINVRGADLTDPNVIESTIINCQGTLAYQHRGFVFNSGEGPDSVLAGITVKNGYRRNGGGIYCSSSPTITHCIISNCRTENRYEHGAGGIHCQGGSPIIKNCTITKCFGRLGGALGCNYGSPVITSCEIVNNSASTSGGMWVYKSKPVIRNCLFEGNSAGGNGHTIYCNRSNLTLSCSTIVNNTGGSNCLYLVWGSTLKLENSIVWGNKGAPAEGEIGYTFTIRYTNIQGGWEGEGNINTEPMFFDPVNGDYHLQLISPCIDSGDPNYQTDLHETDFEGNPRVAGEDVDMGAYETFLEAPILEEEPAFSLGTTNTIFWDCFGNAEAYYAECSAASDFFDIVDSSGWIDSTSFEFGGLDLGELYWYRVKAKSPPGILNWYQMNREHFETDLLEDTTTQTSPGDIVLAGTPDDYTIDILGSTGAENNYNQGGTVTIFQCDEDRILIRIEQFLRCAYTRTDLRFNVYEATEQQGVYNLIHTNQINTSERRTRFHSSGNISVPLTAGRYYAIGCSWNKRVRCWNNPSDSNLTWGIHCGSRTIPFASDTFSGYSGDKIYYQRLWTYKTPGFSPSGTCTSTPIDLPNDGNWIDLNFGRTILADTDLTVDILDGSDDSVILADVCSPTDLTVFASSSIKLRANLLTYDPNITPALHYWYVTYIDPCAVIESDWSNVESSVQVTLGEAVETVLDTNSLKSEKMMNALLNKIDVAQAMIEDGRYGAALNKLENDILAKTDGCAESGEPDKSDWIITCEAQDEVYPLIIETIDYVMGLME
jgi:hypothetical protein